MMGKIQQMEFTFDQTDECISTYFKNLPIYGEEMALIVSKQPSEEMFYIESRSQAHFLLDGQTAYIGKDAIRYFNSHTN